MSYVHQFIELSFHFLSSFQFLFLIVVRYRAGTEEQREGLTDDNASEDSLGFSDDSVSVVYKISGQHIKD